MFVRAAFQKTWEDSETHSVSSYAVHSDPNIFHREQMEDTYFFEESADNSISVFGVLDGHNGRAVVQFIAQQLPKMLLERLEQDGEESIEDLITETFLKCDELAISELGKQALQTGTTCSICVVRVEEGSKVMYCANIGDTSAHLYEANADLPSIELTSLHRASSDEEKQRVKDSGSFVSMDRIEGKLEVFRAFGDSVMKSKGLIATPSIKRVELKSKAAANASFCVVVACDGLWDFVKKEEIDGVVRRSGNSSNSIARDLTALAKARKSTDNITVMAVEIAV